MGDDNAVAQAVGLLNALTFALFERANSEVANGMPFLVVMSDLAQRTRLAPTLPAQAAKAGVCLVSSWYGSKSGSGKDCAGATLLLSASSENYAMSMLLNLIDGARSATMVVRDGVRQIIRQPGWISPLAGQHNATTAPLSAAYGFTDEPAIARTRP